ncbi:hypothetical protein D3C76_126000 [compost metagenome]
MIEIEKIEDRRKLRLKLLQNLYALWFSTGPEALTGTKKELYPDHEHLKAYHYLIGKELIIISPSGERHEERLTILISAKGIDYVEERLLRKSKG